MSRGRKCELFKRLITQYGVRVSRFRRQFLVRGCVILVMYKIPKWENKQIFLFSKMAKRGLSKDEIRTILEADNGEFDEPIPSTSSGQPPCPRGKLLKDLLVTELKTELKRRGLSTSGIRKILVDRLKTFLESQDIDVSNFRFEAQEIAAFPNKKPKTIITTGFLAVDYGAIDINEAKWKKGQALVDDDHIVKVQEIHENNGNVTITGTCVSQTKIDVNKTITLELDTNR